MDKKEWLTKTKVLHNMLVARATGNSYVSGGEYEKLREEFIHNTAIKSLIPDFLNHCILFDYFWTFIRDKFKHYDERRNFLKESFKSLFDYFESSPIASDSVVSRVTEKFDSSYVSELWQKALERRENDPDGAITAARTLLEATCKHILDKSELSKSYKEKDDLPSLYGEVAKLLNLSPTQHTEQQFKQILGGCTSIVNGLASVRNKISDAHGSGIGRVKPSPRHASFAVNIAGTTAMFLIETWENKQNKGI